MVPHTASKSDFDYSNQWHSWQQVPPCHNLSRICWKIRIQYPPLDLLHHRLPPHNDAAAPSLPHRNHRHTVLRLPLAQQYARHHRSQSRPTRHCHHHHHHHLAHLIHHHQPMVDQTLVDLVLQI